LVGTQNVHFFFDLCGEGEESDKIERPMIGPHGKNDVMRISPEPLHPLRSWRELWQSQPTASEPGNPEHTASQTSHWKQPKRSRFNWFSHLFHRDSHK
jgi:hypothetical protein